ncbi:MAG TPA: PQQ-binding-like beta-propeller repeat protein [Gemmataceae bacterium]|jgi:WD40 repeat protein
MIARTEKLLTLPAGLLTVALTFAGAGVGLHPMLACGTPEAPKRSGASPAQPDDAPHRRTDRYGDPLPPGVLARLGTRRFRGAHGCLAFSPDGKWLAAATDGGVALWETATGREVRQIDAPAWYLSFSPDGKRLACCNNLHCHVLDVISGKELFAVAGTHGVFAGDGKKLVTADTSISPSHVYVWDARTGRRLRQWAAGEWVEGLTLAANGRVVAWTNRDKPLVQIRDLENDAIKRSIQVGAPVRSSLALTPDGKMLAIATNTGVSLRNPADGEEIRAWSGRVASGPIFAPDGKRLAWIGFDERGGEAQLWTAERDGGKQRAVGEPINNFGPPCFSPDGKLLAFVTYHHVVLLRDVANGKQVTSFDAHTSAVIDVAFSADGQQVVSRSHDNTLFVWQTRSGKLLRRLPFLPPGHEFVAPLLSGGRLLTGEPTADPAQGRFWLRDMQTGRQVVRVDGRPEVSWPELGPSAAAAAPGGRYVAVRGRAADLAVLEVRTGRCLYRVAPTAAAYGLKLSADGDVLVWYRPLEKKFEVHVHRHAAKKELVLRDLPTTEHVQLDLHRSKCVAPDGRWLLVTTEEGRLRRWDLMTGKEVSPLAEALRTTWELCWSPDGQFVAAQGSASPANVIDHEARRDLRVWDMKTGRRLPHLTVLNRQGGMHVHYSHDSRTMLTTDLQGVIHLWEVATGKERARLTGHLSGEIGSLALSADGRLLVSGGYDSQALVWDLTGRMPDGRWHSVRQPPEKLRAAWKALASEDARAAYAAMWQLTADPEGAVSMLREQLRPVARPKPGQVARLLTALDSEKFAERERATRELEMLEETAAAELRQTLTRKPSLEVRRRVEVLLERLNNLPAGEQLQVLRALEVLEHLGTPEARRVLKSLAEGAPQTRTTEEACRTLRRLDQAAAEKP